GSFQAVKHKLASAFVRIESARAAAWYAAYAIARRLPDASLAASVAKAVAAESEALMNTEALQCHGGIGFTWEHDLHMWMKRGKSLESSFGSAADHRARVAEQALEEARANA
ncbi:MAG: acyl-CoA dehydrogenase family protein, partial [Actinomycetota bacterium]